MDCGTDGTYRLGVDPSSPCTLHVLLSAAGRLTPGLAIFVTCHCFRRTSLVKRSLLACLNFGPFLLFAPCFCVDLFDLFEPCRGDLERLVFLRARRSTTPSHASREVAVAKAENDTPRYLETNLQPTRELPPGIGSPRPSRSPSTCSVSDDTACC